MPWVAGNAVRKNHSRSVSDVADGAVPGAIRSANEAGGGNAAKLMPRAGTSSEPPV
jgi:hypothetical protein